MTDGAGNATPLSMANNYVQLQAPVIELIESTGGTNLMQISSTNVYFEGAVDFTNASVTGISAGLVSGVGTDSMVSSSTLTTNPATALNPGGIALGENAQAGGQGAVIIGRNGTSLNQPWNSGHVGIGDGVTLTQEGATAVGANSTAGAFATTVGRNSAATGYGTTVVGYQALANSGNGISIGKDSKSRADNCITIGYNAIVDDAVRVNTVVIGAGAKSAQYSTAIGAGTQATADYATGIGDNARAQGSFGFAGGASASASGNGAVALGNEALGNASGAVSIGQRSEAALTNSVALGYQITAQWANATTVNQMAFENYANLNFADDAAAALGGVPLGGIFHTNGAMKIRYTL